MAKAKPPRDKRSPKTKMLQAIESYADALVADSWKGGGNPADIPAIEGQLATARLRLNQVLDEFL